MFEAILMGLIVFAAGYTLAMRVMARRADVLHGEFIHADDDAATTAPTLATAAAGYLPKRRPGAPRRRATR